MIVPPLRWSVKEKMKKPFRCCRWAGIRIRYLIIYNLNYSLGGACAAAPPALVPASPFTVAVSQPSIILWYSSWMLTAAGTDSESEHAC
jgi:hypothetical protein